MGKPRKTFFLLFYVILMIFTGCLEPYQPTILDEQVDIVVVDGFINSTENTASVRLSHASPLTSNTSAISEPNAFVSIEEEGGSVFDLSEAEPGYYTLENVAFDHNKKYRLHIYTSGNSEYFSDYITITNSPPIDSVTWEPDEKGIHISVNSHDPAGQTRYYTWSYEETWEYNSSFFSTYKIVSGEALPRHQDDRIFTCWSKSSSTKILIGSSSRLSEDVIRDFPIAFVPGTSVKLTRRYSILVKQRVLTKEAYDFWTQLQKTTESLGGLFDPQPSQVLGNIHSASETMKPVLGYFSGGQTSEKRLFVKFQELPNELLAQRPPPICGNEFISELTVADIPTTPDYILLIDPIYVRGVGIVGYTTAAHACIDCQDQGGSTKQPDFW